MRGPAGMSGLLTILLLSACTSPERPDEAPVHVQLTSALDYRPVDKRLLDEPFVSMRVQLCEATGGTHCRTLRMPVDTLATLESPKPVIAFITLYGVGGGVELDLRCAVTDANRKVAWTANLPARTPDDFSPHLPFYRSITIPQQVFEHPGAYAVTVSAGPQGSAEAFLTASYGHAP